MADYGSYTSGVVTVSTQTSTDCIATPGATAVLHLTHGFVSIGTFAASAKVALDDGTTTFWKVDAADDANGGSYSFNFGEKGYALAANKALKLTVSGGNASATAWFTGYVR